MMLTLILSLIQFSFQKKIVSMNYTDLMSGRHCAHFIFDTRCIEFDLYFNTYLPYTILDKKITTDIGIVGLPLRMMHLESTFDVYGYNTNIVLNNNIDINYSLYVTRLGIPFYADKGIGLGYKIEDESFSIVHQLYKNNKIAHLSFALEENTNNNGSIHFGGIPNDNHLILPYKGEIKIDEDLPTWGGRFNSIVFRGIEYSVNQSFIINNALADFLYSNELYDMLRNDILHDLLNENKCSANTGTALEYLTCDIDINNNTEIIEFIIDKTHIHFHIKDLFDTQYNTRTFSSFCSNPYPFYNFTGVIFGINFLKHFNYSLFDYSTKTVSLYSDYIAIEGNLQNSTKIIIVFFSCSLICVVTSIILLYIKYIEK